MQYLCRTTSRKRAYFTHIDRCQKIPPHTGDRQRVLTRAFRVQLASDGLDQKPTCPRARRDDEPNPALVNSDIKPAT